MRPSYSLSTCVGRWYTQDTQAMSPWGRRCADTGTSGGRSTMASERSGTVARRMFGRLRMATSPVTRTTFAATMNDSSVIAISLESTVLLTANAHERAEIGSWSAPGSNDPTDSCTVS